MIKNLRRSLRTWMLFAVLGAVVFAGCSQTIVLAVMDEEFYASNEVLYYDPDAVNCRADSNGAPIAALTGNDNPSKIFNYLITKGLTPAAAAGFLGNMKSESQFNPNMEEPTHIVKDNSMPINGHGFGLIQWSFTPRQAPLVALAQSTGRNTTDLGLQLDYMWKELTDPSLASGQPWEKTIEKLKGVNDPVEAATIIHYDYERSGQWPNFPAIRGTDATYWFNQLKGSAASTSSTGTTNASTGPAACSGGTSSGGAGNGGIGDYMDNAKFTLFNQCSAPWGGLSVPSPDGTACQVACGPASMAMIIVNMTGKNITPTDTINYVTQTNKWYGTGGTTMQANQAIAVNWGLKADVVPASISVDEIKAIISKGGMVMMAGLGTTPYLSFVNHYVVIRGITTDGKFRVADPNGHSGDYDINTMMADIRNAGIGGVAVYK